MSSFGQSLLAQWILLPLMLLPVLYLLLLKHAKRGLNLPPAPPKLPLLGHLHLLACRNPHQVMFKLSQKYGPAMLLQLGTIPTLIVSSADMAREFYTHDAGFCSRSVGSPKPQKLSYGFLDVAFAPHSRFQREMKKLFSYELLKTKRDQSLWTIRVDEANKMVSNLTQLSTTPVNINDHIFSAVDGILGQVAFGKSYGATQFNGKKFQDVMDECMNILSSFTAEDFYPGRIGRSIDILTGYRARMETNFSDLDEYFMMVIHDHLDLKRPRSESEDFVDILLRLSGEAEGESRLSMNNIKSLVMVYFLPFHTHCACNTSFLLRFFRQDAFVGGVDTTAVSIVWAMAEQITHPNVLEKATAEVRSVAGEKHMVEESDIEQLKYIKCI